MDMSEGKGDQGGQKEHDRHGLSLCEQSSEVQMYVQVARAMYSPRRGSGSTM
jgi:hypothetical protein